MKRVSFEGRRQINYAHFKTRLMERFGLELTLEEWEALNTAISTGRFDRVPSTHDTTDRTTWHINIKGQDCCVVWDRHLKCLVTVLRVKWVEQSVTKSVTVRANSR